MTDQYAGIYIIFIDGGESSSLLSHFGQLCSQWWKPMLISSIHMRCGPFSWRYGHVDDVCVCRHFADEIMQTQTTLFVWRRSCMEYSFAYYSWTLWSSHGDHGTSHLNSMYQRRGLRYVSTIRQLIDGSADGFKLALCWSIYRCILFTSSQTQQKFTVWQKKITAKCLLFCFRWMCDAIAKM